MHSKPRIFGSKALPDTGCTRTLIRVSKLKEFRLRRYVDTTVRPFYKVANDTIERAKGVIRLDLQLGNNVVTTEAVVCWTIPEDIVLSWQNCERLGIISCAFPKTIFTPGKPLPLCYCSDRPTEPTAPAYSGYAHAYASTTILEAEDSDLAKLADEFHEVFNETNLQPMDCDPVVIDLDRSKKGYKPLRIYQARRVPIHYQREAKKTLQWYVDSGVLRPVPSNVNTEWCSPRFFVEKPGTDKVRLVVDYREINKYIARPTHPFPSPLDVVHQVRPTSKWFIKADAVSGFYQIPLEEESMQYTTFLLPEGRFMFTRVPMGMNNSSDVFCKRTDDILRNVPDLLKIVDDTLIQAPTKDAALSTLRMMLECCRKNHLTLSRDKLKMGNELPFAGFLIGDHGVRPDPRRTSAITQFPPPKDQSGLRSFMGLVQQLGFFIPDLAHLSEPLRKLMKKNTVFLWLDEHQQAFEKIKEALTSDLVVKAFDPLLPAFLLTDASRLNGMGFALLQKEEGKEIHQLVQCGSRSLIPAETRYATNELECLAIAWAVKACRHYLLGAHFTILTDHRPLVGTFQKPLADIANPRLLRYRESLMPYSFDVTWTPGKSHHIADALSRAPAFTPPEDTTEAQSEIIACAITALDPALQFLYQAAADDPNYRACVHALAHGETAKSVPAQHPARTLASVWDDLSVHDGVLMLYDAHRIFVPASYRERILKLLHLAHPGIQRQKALARNNFYWPRMNDDITAFVNNCNDCQTIRQSQSEPLLQYTPATRPMQSVSLDLFELRGIHYLIMVDRFSLFTWVHRYKPGSSLGTTATTKCLRNWFLEHGLPNEIVSDNGPQFRSEFKAFCDELNITHTTSSPHHSQSNGLAESAVKNMKTLLEKCDTYEEFERRLLAWRNTPSAGDATSPAEKFYGRRLRTTLPTIHHPPATDSMDNEKLPPGSLPILTPGTLVRIQNPHTKRWDEIGKVNRPTTKSKRSYVIERADSAPFVRNRRFLRPVARTRSAAGTQAEAISQPEDSFPWERDDFFTDHRGNVSQAAHAPLKPAKTMGAPPPLFTPNQELDRGNDVTARPRKNGIKAALPRDPEPIAQRTRSRSRDLEKSRESTLTDDYSTTRQLPRRKRQVSFSDSPTVHLFHTRD